MGCLVISYTKRDVALSYKINMKLTLNFFNLFYVNLFCFFTFYPFSFLFLSFVLYAHECSLKYFLSGMLNIMFCMHKDGKSMRERP